MSMTTGVQTFLEKAAVEGVWVRMGVRSGSPMFHQKVLVAGIQDGAVQVNVPVNQQAKDPVKFNVYVVALDAIEWTGLVESVGKG